MCTPNLFSYATKELSQDAIICWLIAWALTEPEDENECGRQLRDLGRAFVHALLAKHDASLEGDIQCPEAREVHRQDRYIDVLARIRNENAAHVLLIESKIDEDGDPDTLKRYFREVIDGNTKLGRVVRPEVRRIFLKTGNQSRAEDERIEQATGFMVFNRRDFLDVLDRYQGDHSVVKDFRAHLQRKEDDFNGFRHGWSWRAWEGLYRHLDGQLGGGDWDYANPPGGAKLLVFWWHRVEIELEGGEDLYLQIEARPENPSRRNICFKVKSDSTHTTAAQRRAVRDKCRAAILNAGGGRVTRPRRMGVGRHMTVAVWKGDWLVFNGNGLFDLHGTVANLQQAEQIIDTAVNNL